MYRLGMTEGVPIESKLISKRIENAQKAVEAQNFEARKHLLEYDDVMNKQRETIYSLRRAILEGSDQKEMVLEKAEEIAFELVDIYCPKEQHPDEWNLTQFSNEMLNQFGFDPKAVGIDIANLNHDTMADALIEKVNARYEEKEKSFSAPTLRWLERHILLDVVDAQWKDHLLSLDHLKEGINLRGYAQKDPLVEFKREAFTLFDDLMDRIDKESVRFLFLMQQARPDEGQAGAAAAAAGGGPRPGNLPGGSGEAAALARSIEQRQRRQQQNLQFQAGPAQAEAPKPVRAGAKVGRNDPCPCGSGKKYKKCHGATA
jgi:preprotein translocase subunit SecA